VGKPLSVKGPIRGLTPRHEHPRARLDPEFALSFAHSYDLPVIFKSARLSGGFDSRDELRPMDFAASSLANARSVGLAWRSRPRRIKTRYRALSDRMCVIRSIRNRSSVKKSEHILVEQIETVCSEHALGRRELDRFQFAKTARHT
jgi:hypothetical protein